MLGIEGDDRRDGAETGGAILALGDTIHLDRVGAGLVYSEGLAVGAPRDLKAE